MRFELFNASTSCSCKECDKDFYIKGHWFNQIGLDFYLDYWWILHCLLKHKDKLTLKGWGYVFKMTGKLLLILLLELIHIIWWIIGIPFRFIFG